MKACVVSDTNITFNFVTSNINALAGSDYNSTSGNGVITVGSTTTIITVPIIDDSIDEINETFNVFLSAPLNATISDGTGLGTILDNDVVIITPTLNVVLTPKCIKDVPYVDYQISLSGLEPAGKTAAITWKKITGENVQTLISQPLSGTLMWPGAAKNASGQGIAWPGWKYENGQWIQLNDGLRPEMNIHFSVNPGKEVTVSYPPATPVCSTAPDDTIADDSDKDGVVDIHEGVDDYDADGTPDYLDYDPMGYFYDVDTSEIISGGKVSVTCNPAQNIVYDKDGSDGQYQWRIDGLAGAATCNMTFITPYGYTLDGACPESISALDPTGQSDPYIIGSTENGATNKLIDASCASNNWYASFILEPGDPSILSNNIPIRKNTAAAVSKKNTTPAVAIPVLNLYGLILLMLSLIGVVFYNRYLTERSS